MAQSLLPETSRLTATISDFGETLHNGEAWKRVGKLGEGAYGSVWQEKCVVGPQEKLRNLRAVKISRKRHEKAWRREVSAMHKFSKLHGWYDDAGSLYIAMEYIAHGTLQDHVREKALPENEAMIIVGQLAQALKHMHDADFLHRDLKPLNILVARPAPHWHVKLADFGVTKDMNSLGVTTVETGTLAYMAPEVLLLRENKYSKAGDVWALGVVTYYLLTRTPPFKHLHELVDFGKGEVPFPVRSLEKKRCSSLSIKFIESAMSPAREFRPAIEQVMANVWLTPDSDTDSDGDGTSHLGAPSKDWADTWDCTAKQDSVVTDSSLQRDLTRAQVSARVNVTPNLVETMGNLMLPESKEPKEAKVPSLVPERLLTDLVSNRMDIGHALTEASRTVQAGRIESLSVVTSTRQVLVDRFGSSDDRKLLPEFDLVRARSMLDQVRFRAGNALTQEQNNKLNTFENLLERISVDLSLNRAEAQMHGLLAEDGRLSSVRLPQHDQTELFTQFFNSVEFLEAIVCNPMLSLVIATTQGLTAFLKDTITAQLAEEGDPETGLTLLHLAVFANASESVKVLLASGCDVDVLSRVWGTPLCTAAAMGLDEIMDILLDSGADVLAPGGCLGSALHGACASGNTRIIIALLQHGAQPDLRRIVHLHVLADVNNRVKIATVAGKFMYRECSPMVVAIHAGDLASVQILASVGADVNALHRSWTTDVANIAFVNAEDKNKSEGSTLLMLAAGWDHSTIVQFLLDSGARHDLKSSFGSTAVLNASEWNSHKSLDILLRKGASVFDRDNEGWGPLQLAANSGCLGCLTLLLDCGLDVNDQDDSGYTALIAASKMDKGDCVKLLCSRGADVEMKTFAGNNALHFAAQRGWTAVIHILLQHGARPDVKTEMGQTPMMLAVDAEQKAALQLLTAAVGNRCSLPAATSGFGQGSAMPVRKGIRFWKK